MKVKLKSLFTRCLNARYISTDACGDYAIQVEGDTLFLLFQKSRGRADWINNFKFGAKPYKHMAETWYAHRGFTGVWRSMRDDIEAYVAEILKNHPEIKKIVCVGYSHGGALAVLATEDMAYLYADRYTVEGYGFGAPRVLWGVIPEKVKQRLECFTLVRNIPDIVTHVPPFIFGYRHVGKKVKIGEGKKYGPFSAHYHKNYTNALNS